MPNKMIYVSDKDLPLLERAQALTGGNLSAAIVRALRNFVELEQGKLDGFKEIVVNVGPGKGLKQRFSGLLLGEWMRSKGEDYEHIRVYQTPKGKFAVHRLRTPSSKTTGGWKGQWGLAEMTMLTSQGGYSLDVYESLEALTGVLPLELYEAVVSAARPSVIEDLDL